MFAKPVETQGRKAQESNTYVMTVRLQINKILHGLFFYCPWIGEDFYEKSISISNRARYGFHGIPCCLR